MPLQLGEQQKLAGVEQMVPIRPSSFSEQSRGFVAMLDRHVRYQTLLLPKNKVLGNDLIYMMNAAKEALGKLKK